MFSDTSCALGNTLRVNLDYISPYLVGTVYIGTPK